MRFLIGLTVLLGALLIGAAGAQPPPLPVVDDVVLERFTVACAGDPLIVPVTLQGKTYPFVLDTGASVTMYDTSLKPLLGSPVGRTKVQGLVAVTTLEEFSPPEAFLGRLPLPKDQTVLTFDFRPLRERGGFDVRGVLGMDFLENYVVAIDFDRGSLTFRRQVGNPRDLGQALSISRRPDIPCLLLDIPGAGGVEAFRIDTGHTTECSGSLDTNLFRRLVKAGVVRDVTLGGVSVTASGKDLKVDGRTQNFSIGPFQHRNLLFSSPASGNWLGLAYWSRYKVTLDFPGLTLYLKPGAHFDRLDQPDRSGFDFARCDDGTVVERVEKGSPAAQAGIEPGDVLKSVAGIPVDQGSLFPIRRLLRQQGQSIKVKVRHGKEEREPVLPLGAWPAVLASSDIDAVLGQAR
jgi:hypothetical protein